MVTLSRTAYPNLLDTVVALVGAGSDRTRVSDGLCAVLRAAIAERGGYCDWAVDYTGWVVTLHLPEEQIFSGSTLVDGLLSCLAWLDASPGRGMQTRG